MVKYIVYLSSKEDGKKVWSLNEPQVSSKFEIYDLSEEDYKLFQHIVELSTIEAFLHSLLLKKLEAYLPKTEVRRASP